MDIDEMGITVNEPYKDVEYEKTSETFRNPTKQFDVLGI